MILKIVKLILLFTLIQTTLMAQQQRCNQDAFSKDDIFYIPEDVCIPKDFIIYSVYGKNNKIDFNKDGLKDFVFSMFRKPPDMGDTTFLVFYKKNKDSSYSFVKQFGNIIPVNFESDNENPILKDSALQKIFDCYTIPNPLNALTIKNDTIKMVVNLDEQNFASLLYDYAYDVVKNDWFLVNKVYIEGARINTLDVDTTKKIWLSQFSYCNQTTE
jgi:hypothetical protein